MPSLVGHSYRLGHVRIRGKLGIVSSAGLGPYPYDDEVAPRLEPVRRTRVLVWVGSSALIACIGAFVWVAIGLN
jgi:hypothetical protein